MSSDRNIFPVTGPLCGEFTGHQWIPRTKANDAELWCFFIIAWIYDWVNNREAADLRRHRAHYDVIVMLREYRFCTFCNCLDSWRTRENAPHSLNICFSCNQYKTKHNAIASIFCAVEYGCVSTKCISFDKPWRFIWSKRCNTVMIYDIIT